MQTRPSSIVSQIPWKIGDLGFDDSIWKKLEEIDATLNEIKNKIL